MSGEFFYLHSARRLYYGRMLVEAKSRENFHSRGLLKGLFHRARPTMRDVTSDLKNDPSNAPCPLLPQKYVLGAPIVLVSPNLEALILSLRKAGPRRGDHIHAAPPLLRLLAMALDDLRRVNEHKRHSTQENVHRSTGRR